jgi:uncharacterized UBP type Zn finger protein
LTAHLGRKELDEKFKSFGQSIGRQNIDKEQQRLANLMMKKHRIHQLIGSITKDKLTTMAMVGLNYMQSVPQMRKQLANHYFKHFPNEPLTALRKDLEGVLHEQKVTKVGVSPKNPNGANLCYVNSCINLLLCSGKVLNNLTNNQNNELVKLLLSFALGNGTQNATHLRDSVAMKFPQFGNTNQQCPAEFLLSLINSVESLKDLTRLEMMVSYECRVCKVITNSPTTEEFLMLTENIKGDNISEIYLNNRTSYLQKNCHKCRTTLADHKSTQTMIITPKVLLLNLKRFDGMNKFTVVEPCKNLVISPDAKYVLKSVIEHHGDSSGSGHITATLSVGNNWKICNDTLINDCEMPTKGYIFLYELEDVALTNEIEVVIEAPLVR